MTREYFCILALTGRLCVTKVPIGDLLTNCFLPDTDKVLWIQEICIFYSVNVNTKVLCPGTLWWPVVKPFSLTAMK